MNRIATFLALGIAALACGVSHAEEWPKWLGPEGTNISKEPIAAKWPEGGPKKLWTAKVGQGFSSPIARDGKLYILAMQGNDDVLTALDAENGKVLWSQSYTVANHGEQAPQGLNRENGLPLPEATPTIDGDRIYTYGGGGDLVARQLADGKEVWKLNVLDQTGAKIITWNEASSPLVTAKLVYVQGGNGGPVAVAVDKATGKIAWKSEDGLGGYAAPILITVGDTPELVIFGGAALYSLNPETGKTLWKEPWKTQYDVNAVTPIYQDGHLFITSSYDHGCEMLTLSAAGATKAWQGKQIACRFQPCVLENGRLYGNSNGRLNCISWPDGKVIWSSHDIKLGDSGSFVLDGDKLVVLSDHGMLSLVQLNPDGPKELGKVQLFEFDNVWASPLIYKGKIFAKGKEELVALDASGK
ncbi:MAG TPA: PQQ-binding-like beta-propeller repeat protein [Tepidisphaeraceae bacterium]|nr:PQQ-binding-like beta-propeller repeat protein [Tepidisphaeraceae bacterium]